MGNSRTGNALEAATTWSAVLDASDGDGLYSIAAETCELDDVGQDSGSRDEVVHKDAFTLDKLSLPDTSLFTTKPESIPKSADTCHRYKIHNAHILEYVQNCIKQDATLSQGVPCDAAVNFGATGIIGVATILKTRCHGIVHAVSLEEHGFLA